MNVLSLFDGMSCGQQALEKAGKKIDKYYASEIDKFAIQITQKNYPGTVQIGSVIDLKDEDLLDMEIDLLIGGSPCQGFSMSGKRKGSSTKEGVEVNTLKQYLDLKEKGFEFNGQSYLFWEYIRVLRLIKPRYFLLENVMMDKKWKDMFDEAVGVKPITINSALVSGQNRSRNYWTNISGVFQPKDKGILFKDILNKENQEERPCELVDHREGSTCLRVANATDLNTTFNQLISVHSGEGKCPTLTTMQGGHRQPKIYLGDNKYRRITPAECERLQTVKEGYTEGVSNSQRYKMLGNGWTVDVIAHIFKEIIEEDY